MSDVRGRLLAVGATGSIGQLVVRVALQHGYAVRVLVRDAAQIKQFPAPAAAIVGDITKPETLAAAVEGIDAVVFTHGTYGDPRAAADVDYGAVGNVLTAIGRRPVRVALMSTIGATDRKGSHDWKRRGERLVRASGHIYTIVRPAWFDYNRPDQLKLLMLQGDKDLVGSPADGVIARRQIAEVLVRSLSSTAAERKTLELHAETGPEQANYDTLFAPLIADPAGALDGAKDKANMPIESEPIAIQEDLRRMRGGA